MLNPRTEFDMLIDEYVKQSTAVRKLEKRLRDYSYELSLNEKLVNLEGYEDLQPNIERLHIAISDTEYALECHIKTANKLIKKIVAVKFGEEL